MKKHYLYLILFSVLILLTIITAFYSANRKISQSAKAQIVGVFGCWERVDPQWTSCSCEGSTQGSVVNDVVNGTGTGSKGIKDGTATCQASNENGPVSCSVGVWVPQDNVTCPTPTPTPIPTPTPPPITGECDTANIGYCLYRYEEYCACQQLAGFWDSERCQCTYSSPILTDVQGNGFALTDAANGVDFDKRGDGTPDRIAWTAQTGDDAWLALDRNDNGAIDSGQELFGNFTPQLAASVGEKKNGFLALAEYDKAQKGGNADGAIDANDLIFSRLRLWQDQNHSGVSEATELFALPQLNITKIDLRYKESKRTDQFGNRFRYRAKIYDAHGAQAGRWAWDVFLVTENP